MSTPVRTPFNIKLSAEEKAALEALRIAMSARSHAEVVRALILETDVEKSGGMVSWRGSLPAAAYGAAAPRAPGTAFRRTFDRSPILDIATVQTGQTETDDSFPALDEPSKRMKAALDAMRIIEELPIEQRLPADKVAAMKKAASPKAAPEPFKSRLKGEWKAP